MPRTPKLYRPQVFLSFAGEDRKKAEKLREDLAGCGIDAFVDKQDITLGGNFMLAINNALAQSDYYVLIWSHASVDRPFVEMEWSAALVRDLQEQVRKRWSFLFVVRLDATPLPPLLAPRYCLDAFDNWSGMVSQLAATWHRDRAVGERVLPAPDSSIMHNGEAPRPTIRLYVRNRALSVAHLIVVPEDSTGQSLDFLVRRVLALPGSETKFNGTVGMRFGYQLRSAGNLVPADGTPLAVLHIVDGATIDLEVQVESFGPGWSSTTGTFLGGQSQLARERGQTILAPTVARALIRSAFGHLTPR
ncbi:MAG: toll/interleukin-1 receptor domain-containing protein [Pseudonocardiaceae bacterium]